MNIDELADIACFSKFHFNRIFRSVKGESVHSHIKRIRLTRACDYLWFSDLSITEIGEVCGFKSTAYFSFAFKEAFGITPKEQRNRNTEVINNEEEFLDDNKISFKTIGPLKAVRLRHLGPINKVLVMSYFDRLIKWLESKGYNIEDSEFFILYYDSKYTTPEEYFRTDICISVSKELNPEGDVDYLEIPVRTYAVAEHHFKYCMRGLEQFCGDLSLWLKNSSYKVDVNHCLHRIKNRDLENMMLEICFSLLN